MINPEDFQTELLDWYSKEARTLPWRNDPDPYKTWISEMMLQQTRVDTVIPYYNRFIAEIPTVRALSDVPEEKLLKLWQGLGYYSRAMNLQKAARILIEKFNGEIPSDIKELQSLPGIGAYSSGAIASIAFGARTCAVDGNVLRVMARITANTGDISDRMVKIQLTEVVEGLLPARRTGDFNQALMDLGATTCLPNGEPKCAVCPVQGYCEAYGKGLVSMIPEKAKSKERRTEEMTVFILSRDDAILLKKRAGRGLLANLWEFPHTGGHLAEEECKEKLEEWGIRSRDITPIGPSRHIFSHLEWHMTGYFILADSRRPLPAGNPQEEWVWASKKEILQRYSIPTAFKSFMKWIR